MSSIPPPLPPTPFQTGPPTPPPLQPAPATLPAPSKSSNTTVIAIVAGVVIFALLAWGAASFRRTLKSSGFDAVLMQTNPGLAMARMAVALNPNLEMVSFNERTGTISMREKSSGQVIVYRFDPEKQELVISTADGGTSIKASETGATLESRTGDGTLKIGEGADRPGAWVPVYPGVTVQPTLSGSGEGVRNYQFWFDTKDSIEKVLSFYAEKFKAQGFEIDSALVAGILMAEAGKRSCQVFATRGGDSTHVIISAVEKQ